MQPKKNANKNDLNLNAHKCVLAIMCMHAFNKYFIRAYVYIYTLI